MTRDDLRYDAAWVTMFPLMPVCLTRSEMRGCGVPCCAGSEVWERHAPLFFWIYRASLCSTQPSRYKTSYGGHGRSLHLTTPRHALTCGPPAFRTLSRSPKSFSRLLTSILPIPYPENPPENVDVPSHTTNAPGDRPESLRATISCIYPIRSDPLCEHIIKQVGQRLKPLLQDSREWLEQDMLEIDGGLLVHGDVADVWVGTMGGRKVAIKSYKPCVPYLPAYTVSGAYLRYIPSTENWSAEVPCRSTGMQTSQGPTCCYIYWSVLHP